jgi:hypothetical protein
MWPRTLIRTRHNWGRQLRPWFPRVGGGITSAWLSSEGIVLHSVIRREKWFSLPCWGSVLVLIHGKQRWTDSCVCTTIRRRTTISYNLITAADNSGKIFGKKLRPTQYIHIYSPSVDLYRYGIGQTVYISKHCSVRLPFCFSATTFVSWTHPSVRYAKQRLSCYV